MNVTIGNSRRKTTELFEFSICFGIHCEIDSQYHSGCDLKGLKRPFFPFHLDRNKGFWFPSIGDTLNLQ